ncbi:phage tail protein [Xanthomonas translucens pv. translucens]|uniref:phage tail protein n=1 Tax=Xanthomonas campestris pv. translucens TaxID=343 RepID=UPI003F710205
MALNFPNGTVLGFSTALASAIAATAFSNGDPTVATVGTGHGIAAGDVLVVTSTWSELDQRVGVAGTIATNAIQLQGLDTSDAEDFPAGEGSGSLIRVTNWMDFSQQGDISTSGGDQQFWTGVFLESRTGQQISVPTFKNAKTFTIPLYFDRKLPWYEAAKKVDRKRKPVVLRMRLPDGDAIYRYGYLSFDADPTLAANNPMQNTATFSALSALTFIGADDEEAGS